MFAHCTSATLQWREVLNTKGYFFHLSPSRGVVGGLNGLNFCLQLSELLYHHPKDLIEKGVLYREQIL